MVHSFLGHKLGAGRVAHAGIITSSSSPRVEYAQHDKPMNVSPEDIKELLNIDRAVPKSDPAPIGQGQNIVVLDRGFVYVGDVLELADRIHIRQAKNIRVWGTTQGLGELRDGPLSGTKLDQVGEVVAFKHSVIHLIRCKGF